LNDVDLQALLNQQNAVETINLIGRGETVKLLIYTFREVVEVYFATWSKTLNPRWGEFAKWVEVIRSLTTAACREEWRGRRLAEREGEGAQREFEGLPPVWFDHLPLRDVAWLEGEAERRINRARAFERKRRCAEAAAEAVVPELAPAPPAPKPAEPPKRAGRKGDPSLLENPLVNRKIAEQYLGMTERHVRRLIKSEALTTEGKGHNLKVTAASLRNYLPPKNRN
jgi:hypothetical protein